ncbi:MAG: metallophosphoesterase [Clostridia bacterium]
MMRHRKLFTWLIGILLGCLCVGGVILLDDMTVSLEKLDYYSEDLPHPFFGYRMLCISDFHDAFYADQIVEMVKKEKPDVVLFLGDMTELSHGANQPNILNLLDHIAGDVPIYGVLGNHEVWSKDVQGLESQLTQHGMQLLNHQKAVLTKDGASIDLIGVRDVTDPDGSFKDSWLLGQMRVYLENVIDETRFTLVACHRANLYPYLNDLKAELMLSGHIHGGVVRIPRIGGLFDIDGSLLPEFDKGLYKQGDMTLYVDSGTDFRISKLRICNGPSVTLLTLKN